ncbi:microfibril-associated glycoprotein 4-like [Drosophila willistoni]|uniref:microfibril-associated glycoprotein 4-like n=1 Tax=Drosophila willistoni TaxID=7260 RepID=UPI001F0827B4|nr:microfibril-associated glycoprotein 4-like [Drosophila willistoni]
MHLESVLSLCVFILLSGFENVISTNIWMNDNENSGDGPPGGEVDLYESYCQKCLSQSYKSKLNEQIQITQQNQKVLSLDLLELKSRLAMMDMRFRDQNSQLSKTIESLRLSNEFLLKILLEPLRQLKNMTQAKETQTEVALKKNLTSTGCKGLSSGIQTIKVPGLEPFNALCNADVQGGGWIVIHKRFDRSESFNRSWSDFSHGFGQLNGEFFIGLEQLHRITNSERYELRIQLENFDRTFDFASYNNFSIVNASNDYALESLGDFLGTIDNLLEIVLNGKFSTFDHDVDAYDSYNCALNYSAWWFSKNCFGPKLNGIHYKRQFYALGSMSWDGNSALKAVQMLIRPYSKVEQL